MILEPDNAAYLNFHNLKDLPKREGLFFYAVNTLGMSPREFSCHFNKRLPARRASDPNFSLAPGYPNPGLTTRAFEIAVILSAFDALKQLRKLLIFLVAFRNVPGKNAEHGQNQRNICQQGKQGQPCKGAGQV